MASGEWHNWGCCQKPVTREPMTRNFTDSRIVVAGSLTAFTGGIVVLVVTAEVTLAPDSFPCASIYNGWDKWPTQRQRSPPGRVTDLLLSRDLAAAWAGNLKIVQKWPQCWLSDKQNYLTFWGPSGFALRSRSRFILLTPTVGAGRPRTS